MTQIERLTAWHEKQIGTVESPSGSNRQRYGEMYGMNGVSWCCQYIWAGFRECGLAHLFYGGGKVASCTALMNWAKKSGKWVTGGYRAGDIILFNFNTDAKAEHIGYCVGTEGGRVVTVEGNTSPDERGSQSNGGCVAKKKRAPSVIWGAFRPDYEEEEMTQEQFDLMAEKFLAEREEKLPAAWSEEARKWGEAEGIISGDGAGEKRYGAFATREELIQILYNFAHEK